jgi:hypothetical protein
MRRCHDYDDEEVRDEGLMMMFIIICSRHDEKEEASVN